MAKPEAHLRVKNIGYSEVQTILAVQLLIDQLKGLRSEMGELRRQASIVQEYIAKLERREANAARLAKRLRKK